MVEIIEDKLDSLENVITELGKYPALFKQYDGTSDDEEFQALVEDFIDTIKEARSLGTHLTISSTDIICKRCGKAKARSEFYDHDKTKNGKQNICKECVKEKAREHYHKRHIKTARRSK